MKNRLREIGEELRTVLAGRSNLADTIVPPLVFAIANGLFGFDAALLSSLAVSALITLWRLAHHQPLLHAFGGLGGVALAVLLARVLNRAEAFFLPGFINEAATIILCLASLIVRRPLVAWTSHLARGWPLAWYWHPRVLPAYSEVTGIWMLFFALRFVLGFWILRNNPAILGIVSVAMGWPLTIILLVASYLYGLHRLRQLRGPSTGEFQAGAPPPWQGQSRGF
jgi:hypothetical protein